MSLFLRNFINKHEEILIPVVVFLVSLALVIFGILPAVTKILDLGNLVGKTRESVRVLSEKVIFLNSQDESGLRQKLATIVSAIPQDKSLPSILGVVDGLSAETGVTLVSLSLSGGQLSTISAKLQTTQEKAIGASLLPFGVSVVGQTAGIVDFISLATHSRRLIKFQNFDISLPSSGSASLRANFQAFYTPLPQAVVRPEESLPQLTSADNGIFAQLTSYAWLSQQTVARYNITSGKADPFSP